MHFVFYIGKKVVSKYLIIYLISIIAMIYMLPESYLGIWKFKLYLPIFIGGYYIAKYKDKYFKYFKFALIPSIIFYTFMFDKWTYLSSNIYQWSIAFSGITIIYYIVKKINNNYFKRYFEFLGRYSLELYLCQGLCLNIGFSIGTTRVISIFISATIISILLAYYTKKFRYARAVLYGFF